MMSTLKSVFFTNNNLFLCNVWHNITAFISAKYVIILQIRLLFLNFWIEQHSATFSHLFYSLIFFYIVSWDVSSLYLLVYDDNKTDTWLSVLTISAIKCPREDNKHPRNHQLFLHNLLLLARVNMHEPAQPDMHRWSICSSVLVSFRLVWHSVAWFIEWFAVSKDCFGNMSNMLSW